MQHYRQTERVGNPLGVCQSLAAERYALLGIPEQPMGLRSHVTGTSAWVVRAVELVVPLGIIEPAPGLTVFARECRLAREQTGRPGAVMRLQTQFFVRGFGSQLLKPV